MSAITVIIPVYKAELFLRRCVDSVLAQTFPDFDLVLVDDGSPDHCPEICDAYAQTDARVHVIHQENGGPSKARNAGIDWACQCSDSQFLAFIDSDDCIHPAYLERLYDGVSRLGTQVSMCRHAYIMEGGQPKDTAADQCDVRLVPAEELMLSQDSFNYAWGKLFSKNCFENLRYPQEVSFGEDNLIIYRAMFAAEKIAFLDCELYYYFYNAAGITKSPWSPRSLDVFEGIRQQLAFYKERGFDKAYRKEIELYIQQCAYQIHRIRQDRQHFLRNRKYLQMLRRQMKQLLEENLEYRLDENPFWYAAMYPVSAACFRFAEKVRRKIRSQVKHKIDIQVIKKRFFLVLPYSFLILGTFFTLCMASVCQSRMTIAVCEHSLETNLTQPLRIVQLTDLHGYDFGSENEMLVEMVREQSPDLILMTGDMLDKSDANADVACALIEDLCAFAPVYYGYGNHETSWMGRTGEDLQPALTEAGSTVLDVEYLDVEVKGQPLRLGGYHGYYRQPGMLYSGKEQYAAEIEFADNFENTDRYKILLCHIPTAWLDWGYIDKHPVDLVLTGHYHGGQIRLPLIGGLYAPYIGFFPEYTEGSFYGEKAVCILSTGLGSSPGIPRIFNLPQITVIDLVQKNDKG